MTAFGPQLIGQTEKSLGALLARALAGAELDERQWVALSLAAQAGDRLSSLGDALRARAQFDDADVLVAGLAERRLLADDRLTAAGRELVATVRGRIAVLTEPLWRDLPEDDVAATERVLNRVTERAREVLAGR